MRLFRKWAGGCVISFQAMPAVPKQADAAAAAARESSLFKGLSLFSMLKMRCEVNCKIASRILTPRESQGQSGMRGNCPACLGDTLCCNTSKSL